MTALAMTLHMLASVIWIGGMFFAHMALRPTANALLEPPQRLPLMYGVLTRFFLWVWISVVAILVSGYWLFFAVYHGHTGIYVHIMQTIGLIMAGLFFYLYFVPYQRMGKALANSNLQDAAVALAFVRRIIGTNLVLGLVAMVLGTSKLF